MSTTLLLDASAAVRAVMDPAAVPVLLQRLDEAALALAPVLMRVESANALWTYLRAGVIDRHEATVRLQQVLLLVHRFIDDAAQFPEALVWAAESGHSVYDALYALTPRRHAAPLLTCDRRLHAACGRSGIASECFGH